MLFERAFFLIGRSWRINWGAVDLVYSFFLGSKKFSKNKKPRWGMSQSRFLGSDEWTGYHHP